MVERPTRTSNGNEPRSDTEREWEVFVRSDADDPLEHVGSITAPSPGTAHERAGRLFAWYATDVWVCPADEVHRFSDHELGESPESEATGGGEEPRVREW